MRLGAAIVAATMVFGSAASPSYAAESTADAQQEQHVSKVTDDLNSNDANHGESDVSTSSAQEDNQVDSSAAGQVGSEASSSVADIQTQKDNQSNSSSEEQGETQQSTTDAGTDSGSDAVDNQQNENSAQAYGFRAMADVAAAQSAAPTDNEFGPIMLTNTGELYRVKPGTVGSYDATTLEPLPYIPSPKSDGSRFNAFANGVNFNAFGVAPDGKMYLVERAQGSSTGNSSAKVILQVWRYDPAQSSRGWTRFGSTYTVTNQVKNLEIQGGAVNPATGEFYFGGIQSRAISKTESQSVYYLFAVNPTTAAITPKGWGAVDSQATKNQTFSMRFGDMIFSNEGDLVIGVSYYRAPITGGRTYANILNLITVASGDLQSSFGVDTEISNSGTNQLDLSDSLVDDNASGITGFSIMPSGNLMVTTQIDARIGSTRTTGSGNTRGALFKVDVATKTATLIQTIPDTPPVELDNFTYGNEKFISDEMRRIWDYPTSFRSQMGPPGYYVYRTWNLGVNDMDGSAEDFAGIVLHKDVVKRENDDDQFTLNVSGAGYDVSTTTSGTEEGVQPVQVGPLPASIGTTFTVSESITSSTDLRDYEPQLNCVAGDGITVNTSAVSVTAKQATATVTIPGTGGLASKVFCTFINDPEPSRGSIHVLKRDASDTNTVLAGATFKLYRDTNDNGVYDGTDTEVDDSERTTDSQGSAVWDDLDYGTYFLREDGFPQGYSSADTVVHDVVLDQETVDINIDNERIPGKVTWQKVDDTTPAQLLGGSQWTLTDPDGVEHVITDCASQSECDTTDGSSEIRDTDPEEGKFSITNLDWGSYKLVETKAPAGYVLGVQSSQSFTFDATHQEVDLGSIANTKAIPPSLSRAGGWGSDWYLYSGFTVLAIAAVVGIGYKRRKATRC